MEKILSIVWYKVLPPVFGGQKGIAHFNKELAKHAELVCLCSRNNTLPDDAGYRILPILPLSKKQFLNPIAWNKITSVAVKEKPSCIILEHPYHGIAALKAKKATGAKLIVHSHNIESERFRQLGKWWWKLLRSHEGRTHRNADLSLFKTEADKEFAINQFRLTLDKCMVLPYGITATGRIENAGQIIRERHGIREEEKILLFAGTLDYPPNADAVRKIFTNLIPKLKKQQVELKILLCGRDYKKAIAGYHQFSHPMVIKTGEVPDIESYFQAADVFINPVLSGGGIQTKTIEALSHHCNVVCFEQTIAGIPADLTGEKMVSVANGNWKDFAHAVVNSINRKEPTPPAFFEYFSLENNVRRFSQMLATLTNKNVNR